MQKRLKKEKKSKRKLQEALEFESKRREQVEQALKQATTNDNGLRILKGNVRFELKHIQVTESKTPLKKIGKEERRWKENTLYMNY